MNKILKKISTIVVIASIAVAGLSFIGVNQTFATQQKSDVTCNVNGKDGLSLSSGVNCGGTGKGQADELFGEGAIFTTIINTLLFLIGAISVIMLVYGGIQYTLSSGDSGKVTNAKNTILYAVVGLIVAILSYAIVNFVLTSLNGNN